MNEKRTAKLALLQEYGNSETKFSRAFFKEYPPINCVILWAEKNIEDLVAKKERLQTVVSTQEMSPEQKIEIETAMAELQRAIQQQHELIDEFKNEVYKDDLKVVGMKTTVSY